MAHTSPAFCTSVTQPSNYAADDTTLSERSTLPQSPSSPLLRSLGRAAFAAMGVGSVVLAVRSYRYLVPSAQPTLPPRIINNAYARPYLYVHAACAATALLVGPWQFIPALRRRCLPLHRWTGRVYVACCLVGGVCAVPIALHSWAGTSAQLGFFGLAVAWLATSGTAWRLAMAHRIPEHKRWMMRSFALTFSAVTFRAISRTLPLVFGLTFPTAYRIGTWACWVPNLLLVEAWMWYYERAGEQSKVL